MQAFAGSIRQLSKLLESTGHINQVSQDDARSFLLIVQEQRSRLIQDAHELASLQSIAHVLLEMKPRQLDQVVEAGELMEIET